MYNIVANFIITLLRNTMILCDDKVPFTPQRYSFLWEKQNDKATNLAYMHYGAVLKTHKQAVSIRVHLFVDDDRPASSPDYAHLPYVSCLIKQEAAYTCQAASRCC